MVSVLRKGGFKFIIVEEKIYKYRILNKQGRERPSIYIKRVTFRGRERERKTDSKRFANVNLKIVM